MTSTQALAKQPHDTAKIEALIDEVDAIRNAMLADEVRFERRLSRIRPRHKAGALNLFHYLAFRRADHRDLQVKLAELGLSSLGRAESHILATIDSMLSVLRCLAGQPWEPPVFKSPALDMTGGDQLLMANAAELLGHAPAHRKVRIMVTMPTEAAQDYDLVRNLLAQGMDCMRINCAHDDASHWSRMIKHLRRAEIELGRSCKVAMDLAGPKLRTGPLEEGPAVLRLKPAKDSYGRMTAPATLLLTTTAACDGVTTKVDSNQLIVRPDWLADLTPGESIRLVDASGRKRKLSVIDQRPEGCLVETRKSVYLTPHTLLHRKNKKSGDPLRTTTISGIAPLANALHLHSGDMLALTTDDRPGHDAILDKDKNIIAPAAIGCTERAIFDQTNPGEPIWFDDGKIGGIIEKVCSTEIRVRITQVRKQGCKLKAGKGINLPESNLSLSAITNTDLEHLSFVATNADIVQLSFTNSAADVELLQQKLAEMNQSETGIILKIETKRGFVDLPDILLSAMHSPRCGIMIARGDLAVESGFERMSEVQEEILWLCEAAHVPVIWATQVLENLVRDGLPSRAEITDAAMSNRAECVMLNKGPNAVKAVQSLHDILCRMQQHQNKKKSTLRGLSLAHLLRDK